MGLQSITLNSAILNNVALLPMQNSPQCEYISLLQVRTVTLNVNCVKFYCHSEVILCHTHTQVECKRLEYKCSKHCTVVGAVLFVDDHWLLLGSWLCVLSGERERGREGDYQLSSYTEWFAFAFASCCRLRVLPAELPW